MDTDDHQMDLETRTPLHRYSPTSAEQEGEGLTTAEWQVCRWAKHLTTVSSAVVKPAERKNL